jgi:bacteriocin-like protein
MSKKKKSIKKKRIEKTNTPQQQLNIPELDMNELKHINGGGLKTEESSSDSFPTDVNDQITE